MRLIIIINNVPKYGNVVELLRRAIIRVWKIDVGRSENNIEFKLEE